MTPLADRNNWNLNIAPDPAYRSLLDPGILYALSLTAGAPSAVDAAEIKTYDGVRAIECELTPDDALYDKFESAGLPITSVASGQTGLSSRVWAPPGAESECTVFSQVTTATVDALRSIRSMHSGAGFISRGPHPSAGISASSRTTRIGSMVTGRGRQSTSSSASRFASMCP